MRRAFIFAGILALLPVAAFAKVTLAQDQGPAGKKFMAHFRVSQGCNSAATTMLTITIPKSVANVDPQFVDGFIVSELHSPAQGDAASWRGTLAAKSAGDFPVAMVLPKTAGPVSFTATQFCAKGQEKSAVVLTVK